MLHLAFAAGLRVSELIALRLSNLEFNPEPVIRIKGKGRRERVLASMEADGGDTQQLDSSTT